MVLPPAKDPSKITIRRGPNIQPLPVALELAATLKGKALIKLGDNITTDHITPAGTWLKYRSNVPKYSESVFSAIDAKFHEKAKQAQGGFVIGGELRPGFVEGARGPLPHVSRNKGRHNKEFREDTQG